jgi:hypothetical protein
MRGVGWGHERPPVLLDGWTGGAPTATPIRHDHESCYERGSARKQKQGFAHAVPPKGQVTKGERPLRLRRNSGAALHPRMKDAECCAGATLIGEAAAQADP